MMLSSEKSANGQTTSYAESTKALGGGSSEEATRIRRAYSISGTEPATVEIYGTVGVALTDAVARAQGSSQVSAQPSKAMPIGPVKAQMARTIKIRGQRHDIAMMVARTPSSNGVPNR